ncbi:MAG: DUF1778 domain-containing protein [Cryobacterium sp.]|nr:DUF1778 domain-containing protein [Oligoflexia bacterium]
MSQAARKKDERIDLRVDDRSKELIERAASISGMSVSTFTLSSTLQAAREQISEFERLSLSNRDRDLFISAILTPSRANAALRAAMKSKKRG